MSRIESLRSSMREGGLDSVLVTSWDNLYYFGEIRAYQSAVHSTNVMPLLIPVEGDPIFVPTAGFNRSIPSEHPSLKQVLPFSEDLLIEPRAAKWDLVKEAVGDGKKIGVEGKFLSWQHVQELQEKLPEAELVDVTNMIDELRMIKDEYELECLREAARITDKIFATMVDSYLRPGMTEQDVANRIAELATGFGCSSSVILIQVFSGERSSYLNILPTDRILSLGDIVLLDYGVNFNHYNTDITRAVCMGRANRKQKEAFGLVKQILIDTVGTVHDGITSAEVDLFAQNRFKQLGVGEKYILRIGHGLGLTLGSEPPYLSEVNKQKLRTNMVLAIEPGIYYPEYGIRVEDNIIVTPDGSDNLTTAPLELIEV